MQAREDNEFAVHNRPVFVYVFVYVQRYTVKEKTGPIDSVSVSLHVSNAMDQFESVCFETTGSAAINTHGSTLLTLVMFFPSCFNVTFFKTKIKWEEELDGNVDHLLMLRVTSLVPVFLPLKFEAGRTFIPVDSARLRRQWTKKIFSANHRKYYNPIPHREKRQLRFLYNPGAGISNNR